MKSNELIRLIERNGWKRQRQTGSHIIFVKDGKKYTVQSHGSKEMANSTVAKIKKAMGLK